MGENTVNIGGINPLRDHAAENRWYEYAYVCRICGTRNVRRAKPGNRTVEVLRSRHELTAGHIQTVARRAEALAHGTEKEHE